MHAELSAAGLCPLGPGPGALMKVGVVHSIKRIAHGSKRSNNTRITMAVSFIGCDCALERLCQRRWAQVQALAATVVNACSSLQPSSHHACRVRVLLLIYRFYVVPQEDYDATYSTLSRLQTSPRRPP